MSKLEDPLIPLFKSIGLNQPKAVEAAKSPKAAATLKNLIDKYSLASHDSADEKNAGLIAAFAGQLAKTDGVTEEQEKYVLDRILDGKLKSVDQVTAAVKHVASHPTINEGEFYRECGIGYSVTAEELLNHVSEYITSNAVAGWEKLGPTISGVKSIPALRWANPHEIKHAVENTLMKKFGPKENAKGGPLSKLL
ncbi:hypothetical protein MPER_11259, partial [Moniliophthora perniciosa FA553]